MSSYAPYTFLPFEKELSVTDPYGSREDLPGFDTIDPKRYSGYVDYDLVNLTPVSVGSSEIDREREDFFADGRGRYTVPGSTMRGFIRSHAEILAFADPSEVIEDGYVMYRSFAGKSKVLRDEYEERMRGPNGRSISGVELGWIRLVQDDSGKHYEIRPAAPFEGTNRTYLPVHEADLRVYGLPGQVRYMYRERIRRQGEHESDKDYQEYLKDLRNDMYRPYRTSRSVRFDIVNGKPANIGGRQALCEGVLLNSEYMNGKQHHYFVSAEKAAVPPIRVDVMDSNSYTRDYEKNCIQNRKLRTYSDFYALPETTDEEKPFFYKLNGNTLVGFGPTMYFRIFYDRTVHMGIPQNYTRPGIGYVQAMFGIIDGTRSYRSRLSFQNAVCVHAAGEPEEKTATLLSPKISAVNIYLDQSGKTTQTLNTYTAPGFRLAGHKLYWKRGAVQPDIESKEAVKQSFRVLPAGSVFHGRIYYENLSESELGLLCMSLRYTDQKDVHETFLLGKGKPYGYGKVELQNIRLVRYDMKQRFVSADLSGAEQNITDEIPALKNAFRTAISPETEYETYTAVKYYGMYAAFEDTDDVRDGADRVYMDLKQYAQMETMPGIGSALNTKQFRIDEARKKELKIRKELEKQAEKDAVGKELRAAYFGRKPIGGAKESLRQLIGKGCLVDEQNAGNFDEASLRAKAETNASAAFAEDVKAGVIQTARQLFDHVYVQKKAGGKLKWTKVQ